ncbi:MAG: hypothetical protein RIR39_765 [Pseudomonadota bacterium]
MLLHKLSIVTAFCCTSLDNKKPAKPYDLRVSVCLCTSLNLQLVGRGLTSVALYALILLDC